MKPALRSASFVLVALVVGSILLLAWLRDDLDDRVHSIADGYDTIWLPEDDEGVGGDGFSRLSDHKLPSGFQPINKTAHSGPDRAIVMAKRTSEDTSWVEEELPEYVLSPWYRSCSMRAAQKLY